MTRAAAVKTGWVSDRAKGCELASPRPLVYQLNGRDAPDALQGFVYFVNDRLTGFDLTTGVETATGVRPGKTTVSQMISRYRKAGFTASKRYDSTFDATFVTVKRKRRTVIEGFAIRKQKRVRDLSIPFTALCD
jgi:hypothetical protein